MDIMSIYVLRISLLLVNIKHKKNLKGRQRREKKENRRESEGLE